MSNNAAASSSRHFPCRWDYCARTFATVDELKAHFNFEHIQHERPAYIPAYKRRRRPDGTWALVEDSYELSLPVLSQSDVTGVTGTTGPSFALPSLPAPFEYDAGLDDALAPPDPAPTAVLDFGAFLRSPSPMSPARPLLPLQSTPASQVPPPSTAEAAGTASTAAVSSAGSGPFVTQAFPNTQLFSQPSQASLAAEGADSSWGQPPDAEGTRPPQTIAFGARAPPSDSPARRVSASGVGFSWGLKK
ncbi:hypothetical protein Q8F55_001215 [Vanrija albida]|uniref:C2H2-type domain-containing protein n=1 Tax=Vanrija albida TaxID=181172 RepID=A0ABR3QGC5_9TREE